MYEGDFIPRHTNTWVRLKMKQGGGFGLILNFDWSLCYNKISESDNIKELKQPLRHTRLSSIIYLYKGEWTENMIRPQVQFMSIQGNGEIDIEIIKARLGWPNYLIQILIYQSVLNRHAERQDTGSLKNWRKQVQNYFKLAACKPLSFSPSVWCVVMFKKKITVLSGVQTTWRITYELNFRE